jgi:SAM-dependent methyltransferase
MSYDKAQAIREFKQWSVAYDRSILQRLLFGPAHRAIISRLQARSVGRPMTLLDVGCGTGVFAARIAAAMPRATIWGMDLVDSMLNGGRARWQTLRGRAIPVQGDSERLPFADAAFDVVTCSNSFHHYPHQDWAVAEMRRVLKPGGRLFLLDGYRDGFWGWFIYDICVAAVEGEVRHASAREFRELFRRAGFAQISQNIYSGPAPFVLTEGVVASVPGAAVHSEAGVPDLAWTGASCP